MRRDPCTGFEYPFYSVTADVWNAAVEEYDRQKLADRQTYEEAIEIVRGINVNPDVFMVEIVERNYEDDEVVGIKVSVDTKRGYDFYDPRTEKEIA